MCTLRAYGKSFDVDRFLEQSPWNASGVFRRGELRGKRKVTSSGFNMGVSDASWKDLASQIKDATKFIQKNESQLHQLKRHTGVEGIDLDFPIENKLNNKTVWAQEERFPDNFIQLAGKAGLAITLSIYPPARRSKRNEK